MEIINWLKKDERLTKNLEKIYTEKLNTIFVTIRLGNKWSNLLNPNDEIAITINDNPKKLNAIGYAKVLSVKKCLITDLTLQDLRENIGAKDKKQVEEDMKSVYGSIPTIISVIRLKPLFDRDCAPEKSTNLLCYEVDAGPNNIIEISLDHKAYILLLDENSFKKYCKNNDYEAMVFFKEASKTNTINLNPPYYDRWHVLIDFGDYDGKKSVSIKVLNNS